MTPIALLLAAIPATETPVAAPELPPLRLSQDAVPEEKEPAWTGSWTLGGEYSAGNSKAQRLNTTADAELDRGQDLWKFNGGFIFSREDKETKQRRYIADGQYNYNLGDRSYLLGQGTWESDKDAEIDYRYIVGAGYGYKFYDTEEWKWAGELGVSYYSTSYGDDTDDNDYVAGRFATNWDWVMNERWTFGQNAQLYQSVEDSDDTTSRVSTKAQITLTESMFGQVSHLWQWNNNPADDADEHDNLVLFSVGWKF